MKIVTAFDPLTGATASGSDTDFPVANLQRFEPWRRWWADAYETDAWLLIDRGAGAGAIDSAFLAGVNFPSCRLQANDTNEWTTPAVNILAAPVLDNIGCRKGLFDLGTITHRYFRLLIPAGQALDSGEPVVPAVGALVLGLAVTLPIAQKIQVRTIRPYSRGTTPSGRLLKWRSGDGRGRHAITVPFGDTWATIRAMDLDWDKAVIGADLGLVGDAWLVYGPDEAESGVDWIDEASASITLEEVA